MNIEKFKEYHKNYNKKYYELHKEEILIYNKKRITFLGKQPYIGINPRTGVCSRCGKVGVTDMHHEQYNPNNILEHTVELCKKCHREVQPRPRDPKTGRFL